jgi:hypothetical protein
VLSSPSPRPASASGRAQLDTMRGLLRELTAIDRKTLTFDHSC